MHKALAAALDARGYDTLTAVQEQAAEHAGRDMLVSAQTGSGKTVAFGLAIAPSLLGDDDTLPRGAAPLALVIAPTRELAMQVKRELSWLYEGAGAQLASTVGGMDMRTERRTLERGAHIVVATPGRLRDHVTRGSIDLSSIRAVVLDEADEMLDLGFREDLEFILSECPGERQTLLFSATVPPAIARLATSFQRNAVRIATASPRAQHADIAYQAMYVAPGDVENAIINVLRYHEAPNAIVFCNTRATVTRLTTRLSNRGFPVVALSGELSQAERTHALQAMRDGRAKVCVATDVAARGIDLPNLDLVIHAEIPGSADTLLHRSGRTGRAGRKGTSVLIVPPQMRKKAQRTLGFAKLVAELTPPPSADDVRARDRARLLADPMWYEEADEDDAGLAAALAERFTPAQLAAAFLRQRGATHSAPEDLSEVKHDAPPKRREFGPGVWFSVGGGRRAGHDPRRLLPMLCRAGGLTKDDIGAIRIRDGESFVQIAEASAETFRSALGPKSEIEGQPVARTDGPPSDAERPSYKPAPRSEAPRAPRRDFDPLEKSPALEAPARKPRHKGKPHRKGPAPDGAPKGEGFERPRKPFKKGGPKPGFKKKPRPGAPTENKGRKA